jgi:hypothetical protein
MRLQESRLPQQPMSRPNSPTTAPSSIATTSPRSATTGSRNQQSRCVAAKRSWARRKSSRSWRCLRHEVTDLFGPDSNFVTYHSIVSTSDDQIAHLSRRPPARVEAGWPQLLRIQYGVHQDSGLLQLHLRQLAVKRDNWNGVKLEIYYLPSHTYDLDKMIGASKGASITTQRTMALINSTSSASSSSRAIAASRSHSPTPFHFLRASASLAASSALKTSTFPGSSPRMS